MPALKKTGSARLMASAFPNLDAGWLKPSSCGSVGIGRWWGRFGFGGFADALFYGWGLFHEESSNSCTHHTLAVVGKSLIIISPYSSSDDCRLDDH